MKPAKGSLEEALAVVRKKYGATIGPIGDVVPDIKVMPSGNIALDHILGVGGVPFGRICEYFGQPASGKSSSALQTCAELQKIIKSGGDTARGIAPDDALVYLDFENAMDQTYAAALGLDLTHPSLVFSQPSSLEEGANTASLLVESGKVRLLVFDSVAAMTPVAALEAETGQAQVALRARLMGQFLQKFTAQLADNHCTALFLNHEREALDMGGRPGIKRVTTPGGTALKYFASVRLQFQQRKTIKGSVDSLLLGGSEDMVVATDTCIKVVKNKVGPPFRQAVVRVKFGKGFDNFWTALTILVANKVIPSSAGFFYFDKQAADLAHEDMNVSGTGRPYVRGEEAIVRFAETHPQWSADLVARAVSLLDSGQESPDGLSETTEEEDPTWQA